MFATIRKATVTLLVLCLGAAFAQGRLLRLDESAAGELDPAKAADYADSQLMFNVYDALVWADSGGNIIPHVAESWTTSEDGTVYTFRLRDDVTFHDGSRLTASDVVFSLERMLAIGQGFSYLFDGWVTSVEAPDDTTVVFTLSQPYAPFLASLVRLPIVNEDVVRANLQPGDFGDLGDYGQAFLSTNDAGSGAYTVVAHNPQELTVMRRFDDYFLGFAENAPDEVHLRYSLEAATVRALMSRREHDITSQWLPTEVLAALAREGFPIYTEGGTSVFYITLNTQRPPTDDAHVRRAIALAFDYDALISILAVTPDLSLGQKVAGPLPNGFPGADPSLPLPERDVAAARAELAQSSYGPSELTMDIAWVAEVPMEEKVALLFQQNLAEIGIDVNIVRVPWTLLTEQAANADTTPHATTVFVSSPFPDPDAQLYSMYHSEAAGTWLSMSWVNDERVDALLNQGRLETDPQERERIYHELQRRLLDIRPAIFGYDQFAAFAHQPNVVVPTLEDHSRSVGGVMGGNWLFRLIEVRD